MSDAITGGCACGAVRYRATGDIEFAFHCCCRRCQRVTGGGHASAFAVPRDGIELTGEIKYFAQKADSGSETLSGFCPACGSPVSSETARMPERLYLHAATLDDPSIFEPTFVVFQDAAQPWDVLDPALLDSDR